MISSLPPFSLPLALPFFRLHRRLTRAHVSMVLGVLSSDVWLPTVACGTRKGMLGFVIVFLLFLNKNIFALDLLLVAIYGVKFYSFFRYCFHESLRITKSVSGQSFFFVF
jgi:hypothetical protein